jgi:hypothetical protein
MTHGRALMVIAVALAFVECVPWGIAAVLLWAFREGLFAPSPPDVVAHQTREAVFATAMTLLNLVAIVLFLARSRGAGWWVLTAVQAADAVSFGVWLIVTPLTDSGTILLLSSGAAAGFATTAVLVAFRQRSGRPAA